MLLNIQSIYTLFLCLNQFHSIEGLTIFSFEIKGHQLIKNTFNSIVNSYYLY
jgi:hypothetical protein